MKKLILLSVMFSLLLTTVTGCGNEKETESTSSDEITTTEHTETEATASTETESRAETSTEVPTVTSTAAIDYYEVYSEIIEGFRTAIKEGVTDETDILGDPTILNELTYFQDQQYLGYAIEDISGDNIPELLIGGINMHKDGIGYGDQIFVAYTCVGDEMVMSFEGAYRSSYNYKGDGNFFYSGSGGAMYSMFGIFSLLPDATEMKWSEYYFTYPKDETYQEIGFYCNTSGETDKSVSEELNITEDEFWEKCYDIETEAVELALTPFVEESAAKEPSQLFVEYQSVASFNEDSCDFYSVEQSENSTMIVFTTDGVLQDLKLLSLFMNDIDEAGNPEYSIDEIYSYGTLESYRPLMVELTFYGDMPSYGVSYTDENGETRCFAVSVSGYDGSLELLEF